MIPVIHRVRNDDIRPSGVRSTPTFLVGGLVISDTSKIPQPNCYPPYGSQLRPYHPYHLFVLDHLFVHGSRC